MSPGFDGLYGDYVLCILNRISDLEVGRSLYSVVLWQMPGVTFADSIVYTTEVRLVSTIVTARGG